MSRLSLIFCFAVFSALPAGLQAQSASFVTQTPTTGNAGNTFFVFLPVNNAGAADASSIEITKVALTHVGTSVGTLETPAALPFQPGTGFLAAGGTRVLDLEFSNSQLVNNTVYLLTVSGTIQANGKSVGFSLNRPIVYKTGNTAAAHSDVINLITLKANTLPDTDKATQNQALLNFVLHLPLVSRAGIAADQSLVWLVWSDTGRKYIILNNDILDVHGTPAVPTGAAQPAAQARTAEPAALRVIPAPATARSFAAAAAATAAGTDVPSSKKMRLLNGMGSGMSTVVGDLQTWLGKAGYVSSGGDMSLASLRTLGGDGVLYIGSHGGVDDEDDTPFNIWTSTPTDACEAEANKGQSAKCTDAVLLDDLINERVTGFSAKNSFNPATRDFDWASHYGIYATAFATKYWKNFGGNAFVYIDTCDSDAQTPSVQAFKSTLTSLGASAYAGWTESVATGDSLNVAHFVFDRLLGADSYCPENGAPCALGSAAPPFFAQRAFDYSQALQDLSLHGLGTSKSSQFDLEHLAGTFGQLAPSISKLTVNELDGTSGHMIIYGAFGSDPRPDGLVTVGGAEAQIERWSPDSIEVDLTLNGGGSSGDVQVVSRSHKSNAARLTEWRGDGFKQSIQANGSLLIAADYTLHFRADIRKYRPQIHTEPVEPSSVGFAAQDSTAKYSASGSGNGIGQVFKWTGSGTMTLVTLTGTPQTGATIFSPNLRIVDSTHALMQIVGESEANAGATCTIVDTNTGTSQTSLLPITAPSSFSVFAFQSNVLSFHVTLDKDSGQFQSGTDKFIGLTNYFCTFDQTKAQDLFTWSAISANGTQPDPKSAR